MATKTIVLLIQSLTAALRHANGTPRAFYFLNHGTSLPNSFFYLLHQSLGVTLCAGRTGRSMQPTTHQFTLCMLWPASFNLLFHSSFSIFPMFFLNQYNKKNANAGLQSWVPLLACAKPLLVSLPVYQTDCWRINSTSGNH